VRIEPTTIEKFIWLKSAPCNRNYAFVIVFYVMQHVKKRGHLPIIVKVDAGVESCT
jgi:hypothetical protein